MGRQTLADATPPVGRPLLVRIAESDEPVVAFLVDDVWYSGGTVVQGAGTLLSATPCMVRARRRGRSLIGEIQQSRRDRKLCSAT